MRKFSKDPTAISKLAREQYRVTQQSGTEVPGTGKYLHNEEPGIHVDVVSGEPLFASSDKFDSGSGWPSFTKPADSANVNETRDMTHGMTRTEVRSAHGDRTALERRLRLRRRFCASSPQRNTSTRFRCPFISLVASSPLYEQFPNSTHSSMRSCGPDLIEALTTGLQNTFSPV